MAGVLDSYNSPTGVVTGPVAGQAITSTPSVPAGCYTVDVYWWTSGTTTSADSDNVEMLAAVAVIASMTGTQGTPAVSRLKETHVVTVNVPTVFSANAIANGGAAAVYHAKVVATPKRGDE